MTVPISKAISSVYLGDGLQTVFAFPFKVFNADDILVSINNGEYISEADANTYSVEINVEDTPGGNITLNNPLPEGQKLVILRNVKFEQAIPQSNGQAHYAEDFEKMVDLLTFQTQYLAEKISRCIELDPTITPTLTELIEQVNSAASSAEQSKTAAESAVNTMTGQVAAHNTADNPHPGKFDPAGTASGAVDNHEALSNPHSQYILNTAGKAIAAYGVVKSDGTKLSGSDNWTVARNEKGKYQLNITDAGSYILITSTVELVDMSYAADEVRAIHDLATGIFNNNTANNIQITRSGDFVTVEDCAWVFHAVKL